MFDTARTKYGDVCMLAPPGGGVTDGTTNAAPTILSKRLPAVLIALGYAAARLGRLFLVRLLRLARPRRA